MFSKQEYLENNSFYAFILIKQDAVLHVVLAFQEQHSHYNLSISSTGMFVIEEISFAEMPANFNALAESKSAFLCSAI